MKRAALVAMVAVMSTTGWAGSIGSKTDRKVTVCFEKASLNDVMDSAQTIASRMFRNIRVTLEWHSDRRFCQAKPDQVIVVSLSTHTPYNLLPGALAYALPYEGVHIEVFYDRMDGAPANLAPYLLAHVLVHEITHVLQGENAHSERGIMKARWEGGDYLHMDTMPLAFTKADVIGIYNGLDARASHSVAVSLAVANPALLTATVQ